MCIVPNNFNLNSIFTQLTLFNTFAWEQLSDMMKKISNWIIFFFMLINSQVGFSCQHRHCGCLYIKYQIGIVVVRGRCNYSYLKYELFNPI